MSRAADYEVQENRCLTRITCADDHTGRIEIWSKGDGDCLFHSCAYLLRQANLRANGTQTELRRDAVNLLRTWFGTVEAPGAQRDWVKRELVTNAEPGISNNTAGAQLQEAVAAYFTRMEVAGTYGDPLCIAAIEDLYDVAILSYNRDGAIILPATNPDGAQTLRLAYVSYSGGKTAKPNHFNPIVADTGQQIQQRVFEPTAIDLELGAISIDSKGGAQPYAPPIRHADFAPLPAVSRGIRAIFVSLTGENAAQLGGPVFSSFGLSWQPPKGSAPKTPEPISADTATSRDYSDKEKSLRLFRPRLTVPLRVGEDGPTSDVDTAALDLHLVLEGATNQTPLGLRLDARTDSKFEPRTLAFTWGDLGNDISASKGVAHRSCGISALDKTNVLFGKLGWQASPYRLTLWSSAAGTKTSALCVYFNVPAPSDVLGIAQVANLCVLPVGDLLKPLADLKIEGARIELLGRNPRPKLSDDKIALLDASVTKLSESIRFNANKTSIVWSTSSDTFVQTSWASFAVIRHEKGNYFIEWLGAAGGRDCYLATPHEGKALIAAPPYFQLSVPNYFGEKYEVQNWRVFDCTGFKLQPLTGVVTTGISSCAGGLTWPANDAPDFFILWHFDSSVSVVIRQLAEMLWKDTPALHTIASVFPQPEEMRKYRNAVVYPPAVAKTSITRMLMRGSHLGSHDFATGCGQSEFGVMFEKGIPVLTGTYGFNKRTWTVREKETDAYYDRAAFDYLANIFEEYRHEEKTPKNGKELKEYSDFRRSAGALKVVAAMEQFETLYRLPVPATWEALAKAARPLGEQPLFYVGTKGTWDLIHLKVELGREAVPPAKTEK